MLVGLFILSSLIIDSFTGILTNENPSQIRPELAREFMDRISDILQGNKQARNRHHPSNRLPEKLSVVELQKFLRHINHPLLIQIMFSLLSRFYSLILIDQSHVDIYSEYSRFWPTSIDYRQRSIRHQYLHN